MQWSDEGLILGVRRHGESSVIAEVMTPDRGRHLGIVRGGRSSRMRPVLQPGNSVSVSWRARLEEHLGAFSIEPETLRAASLMETSLGIYGVQTLAGHFRLLPERDPHLALYRAGLVILDHLEVPEIAAQLMVRFELALLEELGFGLDLTKCAATGTTKELIYVSPKSGRAVSKDAGANWADKMLALPPFLQVSTEPLSQHPNHLELSNGLELTRFFLDRHIYLPRGLRPPDERAGFIKAIEKAFSAA